MKPIRPPLQMKPAAFAGRPAPAASLTTPFTLKSRAIGWWHTALIGIAAVNLAVCGLTAFLTRGDSSVDLRLQLLLSTVYVLGCAYRSVLPVYDVPRVVVVDSPLSSVMVGRTIATIAELAFAAQWAVLTHRIAPLDHTFLTLAVSYAVLPLIVVAEVFSWHSILTTQQRGHAMENSLWGFTAALVVASLLTVGPHSLPYLRTPLIVWSLGGAAFSAFIFLFDVPMYWARWRADQQSKRRYLGLIEGLSDARRRRVRSYRWEDWKDEVVWMTLYFSFGVWSSLSVIYASVTLSAHGL